MNYFIFLPEAKISIYAVTKNTDSVELHCQLGSQNCLQVEKNYESIPLPQGMTVFLYRFAHHFTRALPEASPDPELRIPSLSLERLCTSWCVGFRCQRLGSLHFPGGLVILAY